MDFRARGFAELVGREIAVVVVVVALIAFAVGAWTFI
jgi:hypothetical protein